MAAMGAERMQASPGFAEMPRRLRSGVIAALRRVFEAKFHAIDLHEPWFRNHYRHEACDVSWTVEWSCACNDRCPACDAEIEPYESEVINHDQTKLARKIYRRRFQLSLQRAAVATRVDRRNNPATFRDAFATSFVADKFCKATKRWCKIEDRVHRGVGNPRPLVFIETSGAIFNFADNI